MIKVRILKWGRACVSWSRGRSGRRVTSKLSILDLDVAGSFDSPSVSPTGGELFLLFLRWKKQGGLHHQCSCLVPRRKLTLRASSSSRRWRSTAALHFDELELDACARVAEAACNRGRKKRPRSTCIHWLLVLPTHFLSFFLPVQSSLKPLLI